MDQLTSQQPGDAELVQRALSAGNAGERATAFEAIADRYRSAVLRQCSWWFPDPEAAQDVGQITFEAALTLLADGKGPARPDKLGGWLIEIAKRRRQEYRRRANPEGVSWAVLPEDRTLDDLADDEEPRSGSAVRRAHATRLVEAVVATLTERQQQMYQLRFVQELTGRQAAAQLEITDKAASNEATIVQNLIADGFGALILFQEGRTYCADLAQIIDSTVGIAVGTAAFSSVLREQITRHFGTCATCGKCRTCNDKRRELVGPYVPGLIPILFAAGFRDRIDKTIRRLTQDVPQSQSPDPDSRADLAVVALAPSAKRHQLSATVLSVPRSQSARRARPRRRENARVLVGGVAAALLVALALIVALVVRPGSGSPPLASVQAVSAADVLPAIVYQSGNALELRHGAAPPRTLATLPAGTSASSLTWSWDGRYLAYIAEADSSAPEQLQTHRQLNVLNMAAGTARTWPCGLCSRAAFLGTHILVDSAGSNDTLSAYPVGGGTPTIVTIHGLQTPDGAAIALLGSTPHDAAAVFYISDYNQLGGDDYLYATTLSGRATVFGAGPLSAVPNGTQAPDDLSSLIATSPDHSLLAYGGALLDLSCQDSDSVTVLDLRSDTFRTFPLPRTAADAMRVQSVWVSADDTIYASAWTQPAHCTMMSDLVPIGAAQLQVYQLINGQWVPTGMTSTMGSGGPNGWTATASGTVNVSTDTRGSVRVVATYGTVTVSSGATHVNLGASGAFVFAPAP
jgi:RNA polymerase sigma factor (sigma-70 family)